MADPWSRYQQVIVETYYAVKSGKSSRVHVRPVAGEQFPPTLDVECSRSMRKLYPVGTKFRIYAKERLTAKAASRFCIPISIGRLKSSSSADLTFFLRQVLNP